MTLTKIASTGVEDSLRWVLGANGTSDYTFTGPGLTGTVNDPTIYLTRGHTYIFQNNSGGHPFYIKTSIANGGTNDAYNTGVTNNGGGNGTEIVFTVPHDSPDILYYQCSSHASMAGQFNIAGSVADGSITTAKIADDAVTDAKLANSINAAIAANTAKTSNATHTGDVTGSTSLTIANNAVTTAKIADSNVTTAKINDSAVTSAKLGASAVTTGKINDQAVTAAKIADTTITSGQLAANSVTTSKIADQAVTLAKLPHGTSSNDGKFLRANNGADPTFETVTGTTINNNADNRVITGSGTANTLNGESNLTVGAEGDLHIKDPGNTAYTNFTGSTDAGIIIGNGTLSSAGVQIRTGTSGSCKVNFGDGDGTSSDRSRGFIHYTHSDNSMQIGSNSSERIRITSDGYVGIGTSSPASKLHLYESTSGNNYIHFSNSSTGISTSDGGQVGIDGNEGLIVWQSENNYLRFATNNTERMRILAGGGLTFNGDTAAANALDDYEEGTWTPFFMFYNIYTSSWQNCTMDAAGTIQQPKYTKIGRWVTASFNWSDFQINSSTKDYARIGGLPFTATAYGAALAGYNNVFQYNQNNGGWLANGQTSVEFYRDNNSWNHWVGGQTRHLQVTVHYQAA